MLQQVEIDALVRRIAERARPEMILIFGSYAKGTAHGKSDLDLLVVRETDLPKSRRADDLTPLCATSLVRVDLHVYTPEEVAVYSRQRYHFLQTVTATGIVAYRATG